jgi:ACS family sodium-dependent inorganic phosphate cotransporter-like MFS transporter 5
MIIFNTSAVAAPGVVYLLVGYVPDGHPLVVIGLFTLIQMLFSTSGGGFYKCGTLCSRQYSHFIIANIQFVKCLTLFIAPTLMQIFVEDETSKEQWRNIFILLGVILIVSNFLFCRVATDKPAEFTKITRQTVEDLKRTERDILVHSMLPAKA